jgi:hypothetical protein
MFVCSVKATDGTALLFDKNDQQRGGAAEASGALNKDIGYAVAASANGVFVGGSCADYGGTYGGGLTSDGGPMLIRYLLTSNTIQPATTVGSWINSVNNPGVNENAAIHGMLMSGNNLWVTGNTKRNSEVEGLTGTSVSLQGTASVNAHCGFLANYDISTANTGKLKWAARLNDNQNAAQSVMGRALGLGGCNLYMTGHVGGSAAKMGNTIPAFNAGTMDIFIASVTSKNALSSNATLCLPSGGMVSPSPAGPKATAEGATGYSWSVTSGPVTGYTLTNATTSNPTIGFDEVGIYVVQCVISGGTCPVTTSVTYTVLAQGSPGCPLFTGGGGEDGSGADENALSDGLHEAPASASFAMFPNPANDKVTISTPGVQGDLQVLLFDALGRIVLSQGISGASGNVDIALSQVEPGTYICTLLHHGERVLTERLIVER